MASEGINPKFRPEMTSMPGYLAVQDFLSVTTSIKAAFSRLEVMHADEAENFLKAPAEAVSKQVKSGHMDAKMFIEVALVFGMIVTLADREQRDHDEEDRVRRRVAEITEQKKEAEKADGDDSVPL